MRLDNLNFFQRQYLTHFRLKANKKKAIIYHAIIKFVLENSYAPTMNDLAELHPDCKDTIVNIIRHLEKNFLVAKVKMGGDYYLYPILRPFVTMKESEYDVFSKYIVDKTNKRGIELREKIDEVLYGSRERTQELWRNTFKEAGYRDSEDYRTEKTADDYDRSELPPNFDDTEDSGGLVVV